MTKCVKDEKSRNTYAKVTNSHKGECGTIYHIFGGGIMKLEQLIYRLKVLSDYFYSNGIEDIYTNSKIYEVLISEQFNHRIINGHAHTPDAEDEFGALYEYKHFKLSSSNHSWTFNDFSDMTIEDLFGVNKVLFTVVNNESVIPLIERIYLVSGEEVADYLRNHTQHITNTRRMVNISPSQIINNMSYEIYEPTQTICSGPLQEIFTTANLIEQMISVDGILTSNKLWELLVAYELGHNINPDQKKHDAYDQFGGTYEYKVSSRRSWTFQDITTNVLNSYLQDEKIVLAVVDKKGFRVVAVCYCNPDAIVSILENKLQGKKEHVERINRLSVTIGVGDINNMIQRGNAEWVR